MGIAPKYLGISFCAIPMEIVKSPIYDLPKSTVTVKLYLVPTIKAEVIEIALRSPLVKLAVKI